MTGRTDATDIGRRQLLVAAGAGALAVAVLGATAACSGDTATDSSPSPGSPAPQSVPEAGSGTPSGGAAASSDLAWQRVSLGFVSAYVLVRGSEATVVDTGTEGSVDAITAGLEAAGADWSTVRTVVLTHRHGDHVGGLAAVAERAPQARLAVGEADLAAVTVPGRDLSPLADGDDVMGLQIVTTPGHTPGHVSVFDTGTGVLLAGDALTNDGALAGSPPQYTADAAQATESVRRLAALQGIRVILPGHGDPLTDGAAEALRALATSQT